MNALRQIASRDNSDFKAWKKLAESAHARRKRGQLLLEGLHLVSAWQAAFGAPDLLLTSERGLATPEIRRCLEATNAPRVMLADALLRELCATETPTGLLAVVRRPPQKAALALDRDTLVLDGIQDPGNLGTLLRTAAAAGIGQVALSADCAETWSPKVLRAGQGAHFLLAIHEDCDLPAFLRAFQGETLATALTDSVALYDAAWQSPLAWVMGSEGQGVRPETLCCCRQRIRIPMPGAVESLNVAAAAAICLFEMVRRRSEPESPQGGSLFEKA